MDVQGRPTGEASRMGVLGKQDLWEVALSRVVAEWKGNRHIFEVLQELWEISALFSTKQISQRKFCGIKS